MEFTPEQRAIFEYNDGKKAIRADPLEVRRRLLYELPNISQLMREQAVGDQLLTVKDRMLFRLSVEKIIFDTLKMGPMKIDEIAKALEEPPNWVNGVVQKLVEAEVLILEGQDYRGADTPVATEYFTKAEEAAKMTNEEIATIRFGKRAEETIVNGMRRVFMMDVDEAGEGPTDAMIWKVFHHYQEWMQKKSGTPQETPTSPTNSPG